MFLNPNSFSKPVRFYLFRILYLSHQVRRSVAFNKYRLDLKTESLSSFPTKLEHLKL
ncbi:unnamed protein product [Tenebrio molitor]|nr:unnamed protein product [Tenebrio molitor]